MIASAIISFVLLVSSWFHLLKVYRDDYLYL
jgi:hypothetical protein